MKKITFGVVFIMTACTLIFAGGNKSSTAKSSQAPVYPLVQVAEGTLKGVMDGNVYAFRGIQYATAERFGEPQPVAKWTGVKPALSYGPIAPIARMEKVGTDEFVWPHRYWPQNDVCQYLNVWTTSVTPKKAKPVMVFLHGGGYTNGSSIEAVAYEGGNLSDYGDVVVVSLNHRLNVLGFLDLSAYGTEYKNSAHLSWMDIEAALKWIQRNIAAFGGDPSNVTIFGQSGGGGKVYTLMHMPSANSLYHKAISQSSGSATRFGLLSRKESQRIAELTLQNLGIDGAQVNKLKSVSYDNLITAADQAIAQAKKENPANAANIGWNPVVDNSYVVGNLTDWAKTVPFMTGSVFSEQNSTIAVGDGRKNEWSKAEIDANLKSRFGDKTDAIVAEFQKLFPNKKIQDSFFYSTNGRNNTLNVYNVLKRESSAPAYHYLFAFEAPAIGGTTAFHCSELTYVFHNVDLVKEATGGTAECYAVQDVVARAWANFAHTGNPSQKGYEWKPFTDAGKETMVFDVKSGMRSYDDSTLRSLMPAM